MFSCLLFYASIGGIFTTKLNFTIMLPNKFDYKIDEPLIKELRCDTNVDASFLWKECLPYHHPLYEREGFESCGDMLKEEGEFCRVILPNNTEFVINEYSKKISVLKLKHQKVDVREGCFICQAERKNTTISAICEYRFIASDCGALTRVETFPPIQQCKRIYSAMKNFHKICKVSKPTEVTVEQSWSSERVTRLILRWKKPEFHIIDQPFGYRIKMKKLWGTYEEMEVCLITQHNEDKILKVDGMFEYNLASLDNNLLFTNRYDIKINSLPTSRSVVIPVTIKSSQDLCKEYTKNHNVTLPGCLKLRTTLNCSTMTVTAKWSIHGLPLHKLQNKTLIQMRTGDVYLPINQLSYTACNQTEQPIYFIITLFYLNDTTYVEYVSNLLSCPELKHTTNIVTHTTAKSITTSVKSTNKWVAIHISTAVVVFGVVLLIVFLYCGMKKVRKNAKLLISLYSPNSPSKISNNCEDQTSETDDKVMIVYPHGCRNIEDIVLFIAKLLNDIGMGVLVDVLQTQRIAKEGLAKVLVEDFKRSKYVVMLCTEAEITDLSSHRPYKFVMNKLVSTDCVYHKSDRYIAAYFSKSNTHVPPYLLERSYKLPSRLESFILHLLGEQTFLSSFFDNVVTKSVNLLSEQKAKLNNLVSALNMAEHNGCNRTTCHKGKEREEEGEEDFDFPTHKILEEEVGKHCIEFNKQYADNCSLRFSSTESLEESCHKSKDNKIPLLPLNCKHDV